MITKENHYVYLRTIFKWVTVCLGRKYYYCLLPVCLYYLPRERVNLTLVRTLATHYYSNRNKVIQRKFHCFTKKPPWKDKDLNVSNNILSADLKYLSPLIIRTNPFRHVIHKAMTLNSVMKDKGTSR